MQLCSDTQLFLFLKNVYLLQNNSKIFINKCCWFFFFLCSVIKSYTIKQGSEFTTSQIKQETDLTSDMIAR